MRMCDLADFDDFEDFDDFDLEFSSSSSEDDLIELLLAQRQKHKNYFEELLSEYDENSFLEHFRISRPVVEQIAKKFEASEYYNIQYGCYGKVSALHQVLIFLWFCGLNNSSFRKVSEQFNISLSTLHRIIRRVSLHLSNLSPEVIKWPSIAEKIASEQFFANNDFPGVIGVIDGTHIKIGKPEEDAESYINAEGVYSIQLQLVSDHQKKILDVFVGYPGSVQDDQIFRASALGQSLEERCGRYYLIGDNGFPLSRQLLTPYKDKGYLTPRQKNYNKLLAKNRNVITDLIRLLKDKFRQLHHLKLRKIPYIVHFIRAMCVLHNLALSDDFKIDENVQQNENAVKQEDRAVNKDAREFRDAVATMLRLPP